MADITVRNQGEVDDSGKVNWRGDQVSLTPGDQSIYKSSSVKLADLGSRKVVGDRVFRYARAGGAIGAGDLTGLNAPSQILVTGGAADPADGKLFTFYFATANAAGIYDDGLIISQSGTAANMGYAYRVKTQPVVTATTNGSLVLYDPLKRAVNVTDKWSLFANPYSNLLENTSGTQAPMGICPIAVTTNDYFWLQTWGPAAAKCAAVATPGLKVVAGNTGEVKAPVATTGGQIGFAMAICTASQRGLILLEIAP